MERLHVGSRSRLFFARDLSAIVAVAVAIVRIWLTAITLINLTSLTLLMAPSLPPLRSQGGGTRKGHTESTFRTNLFHPFLPPLTMADNIRA